MLTKYQITVERVSARQGQAHCRCVKCSWWWFHLKHRSGWMSSLLWDMESVALRSILLSCCELRSFTHSNVGELQVCSGRFLLSRAIADPLSFPGHVQKGKFPPET